MRRPIAWSGLLILLALFPGLLFAQSGAINGQIEGLVTDPSGAVVPGAKVTVSNIETGFQRTATTDSDGLYRIPLLPLGAYRVTVEAQGFNRFEQSGITVTSGSIATINVELKVGAVTEAVQVTGEAPITESARVDVGALVDNRRIQNLPLVTRNPYNFILLQPNVSAHPNREFGVPRKINANGFTDRIDYQLDGNHNTQSDRKGIRLIPISNTFVKEVVVATNGFAPEFGNTVGTVYNAVTNSGTNDYHGELAYLFRRTDFSARPSLLAGTAPKPVLSVDNGYAMVGGPVRRDKLHFFGSYERVNRDLPSPITVTAANAAALGLSQDVLGAIPFRQAVNFFMGRADWQISPNLRLMGRYIHFRNDQRDGITGGLNTRTVAYDFVDRAHAVAAQLLGVLRPNLINELRYQYGYRRQRNVFGASSEKAPNIVISGVANLGGPTDVGFDFTEQAPHLVDNVSWVKGSHSLKFGTDLRWLLDDNTQATFSRYTFPSIALYLDAKAGRNLKTYSSFAQQIGDSRRTYSSAFVGLYAQDSWAATPRLNVTYGLRYDLYNIPDADQTSPLELSRHFRVDKNNFAPRVGLAYALGAKRRTVVRANSAFFYDAPQTDIYRRAILENGAARFVNISVLPAQPFAPDFPAVFTAAPSAAVPQQSVRAVAPDFANLYSFNANAQVTQELGPDTAVTVGYLYTKGSHIPIHRQINRITASSRPCVLKTPADFDCRLPDGRPVFSSADPNRLFPQFNNVLLMESAGNLIYNGFSLSLNQRFSHGAAVQGAYTWSHAIDDAPEAYVLDSGDLSLSDPLNRRRDRGNSLSDRRHIVTISGVLNPSIDSSTPVLNYLVNHNQFSFIFNGGSGDVFNITASRELLNMAEPSRVSRPNFVGRNTVQSQRIAQFDLRYSRFVPITERYRIEVLGEFNNLFNHTQVTGLTTVATVDLLGNITAPPTFRASDAREARHFQLGFKFIF